MDENNSELPISSEEMAQLKIQHVKALDLLGKINDLHTQYESAENDLKISLSAVSEISTDANEKLSAIESALAKSSGFVTEIKSDVEKVSAAIETVEVTLSKFNTTEVEVDGKSREINTLVSTATGLSTDIQNSKATALQRLASIDATLAKVQSQFEEMQTVYTSFREIQTKAEDETTGLEAILTNSTDLQKKAKAVFVEIQSFRDESRKYLDETKNNKEATDTLLEQIELNLKTAENRREEVEKITSLIADTGYSDAFQKRERMLRYTAIVWVSVLLLSVFSLVVFLYVLFSGDENVVPSANVILYRLTLTSPLILLIGFSIKQYGNERALNEKYAFKAIRAVVMREHANFLITETGRTDEFNGDFLRKSLTTLYSEPYKVDSNDKKKDMPQQVLDVDLDKINVFAKDLKQTIGSDETIKTIINLFTKLK